ncbi:hypothetical protein ACSQ67_011736 [Phaseolus vulgaris]
MIQEEKRLDVDQEPILSSYYFSSILSHKSLESALANQLSTNLSSLNLPSSTLFYIFLGVLIDDCGDDIIGAVKDDLVAVKERDPACISYVHCLLNFKGFLACQAHRIAHKLWLQGRKALALLIQNRVSEVFSVDIHPGAQIGRGILLDHATGLMVGETGLIGDGAKIGASSVVLKDVPPRTTTVGNPAGFNGYGYGDFLLCMRESKFSS